MPCGRKENTTDACLNSKNTFNILRRDDIFKIIGKHTESIKTRLLIY
jgi:hypothetical protein